MITTTTDICNLALGRLGARRLASYEADITTEAKACRLHFELVRDTLLRRHQWDFAKTSRVLSRLAADPLSEYAAAWQMPADCVRIIRISSGDSVNPLNGFERRGRALLTHEVGKVELVYVTNGVEIHEWDSLFVDAVVLKLAARIAGDITQNPALAQECTNELEALALPAAQTADAREANSGENFGTRHLISQSLLHRARYRSASPLPIANI